MSGQSETKHMPGGLSVRRPHDGYFEDLNIFRDDGLVVAVAIVNGGPGGIEPQEAEANAARIVLTWNCHDDLVAALALAHDYLAANGWEGDPRIEPIRAALAKATSPHPLTRDPTGDDDERDRRKQAGRARDRRD